jgi:predicted PolB exonuclease-like 3'-5' exonuclease
MKFSVENLLVLDIETVRSHKTYEDLPERLQSQWDRKAGFLRTDEDETPKALFEDRGGIYAEFGKVVSISVGFFTFNGPDLAIRIKGLYGHDEAGLLQEFISLLEKFDSNKLVLCAHNGKEFDFPYLCRRMLVNNLKLPAVLDIAGKKPWEINHIDTMELWKFGDRKNFTSLELLATLFDIPTSKDAIDGSQVSTVYYEEDDLKTISKYCSKDVLVTAQLLLKLKQQKIVKEEHIHFIED